MADPPGLPAWAVWSAAAHARPWTVGIEEEVMLLDPAGWAPVSRVEDALSVLPPPLAARASPETHACVLELKTGVHASVAAAAAELAALRREVARELRERMGVRLAAAGTHPLATRAAGDVAAVPRYREIEATMRDLVHREPTMALHVHVSVPDAGAAVRALDGLRHDVPLLLALAANSPFWGGRDSGFASIRTPVFGMFPRSGTPRSFAAYDDYVEAVDGLLRSGAIPEPGFLWWDVRLQPRLGTVEVRVCDAQSSVLDVAPLAALVQCLVRLRSEESSRSAGSPESLAENRFLAARDGLGAVLLDERGRRGRLPAAQALAATVHECARVSDGLGCSAELEATTALAADPGHARQRRHAARHGVYDVPRRLSDEFERSASRPRPTAFAE